MPFPFKKKDDEIGSPEPLDMPKRKPPMFEPEAAPEAEAPGEDMAEATGISAIGERFGLAPEDAEAFAREVMQHFMGMCGEAKAEPEVNESETEDYPA